VGGQLVVNRRTFARCRVDRQTGAIAWAGHYPRLVSRRLRFFPLKVCAKTDNYCGEQQSPDTAGDELMGLLARTFPFVEDPAPHRGKNDDAGHMESPRGKVEFTHLGLPHRVKEELEIPTCAGSRGKKVIAYRRNLQVLRFSSGGGGFSRTVLATASTAVVGVLWAHVGRKVLVTRPVLEIQIHAPNEICGEAPQQ